MISCLIQLRKNIKQNNPIKLEFERANMKKIIQKIKSRLVHFLEIDTISDRIEKNAKTMQNEADYLNRRICEMRSEIKHLRESINVLHKTIENIVHVGCDIYETPLENNHSWAVVCIEGRMNIVKFVHLDGRTAQEILRFLKNFEAGKRCIDSPHSAMMENMLFKF